MRILVPWRAFGDTEKCLAILPQHEASLIEDVERELDTAIADVEDAYAPFLKALADVRLNISYCQVTSANPLPEGKDEKKKHREDQKANSERLKVLKRELKTLEKLENEANEKKAAARQQSEREVAIIREAAEDLRRVFSNEKLAARFFAIAGLEEISNNEFNLNVPRYVDTFEPEVELPIADALAAFDESARQFMCKRRELHRLLRFNRSGQ